MNVKHVTVACVLLIAVTAIGVGVVLTNGGDNDVTTGPSVPETPDVPDTPDVPTSPSDGRVLVVYFSKTGTTEAQAQRIADLTGGDILEIVPTVPYPGDYSATTEIAQDELRNDVRPAIDTKVEDMGQYDTIVVGYPIWWNAPPMAVLTFLEDYDLTGKTVVTFCTSGGSLISNSTSYIEGSAEGATVIEGQRITQSTDVRSWLDGLGLIPE